jgi:hypothetical protein
MVREPIIHACAETHCESSSCTLKQIRILVRVRPVTEYRTLRLRCACGKPHYSEFVPGVDEVVQYGPNIRALAVHLTQGDPVPLARSSELLRSLYGLDISPATICAWVVPG